MDRNNQNERIAELEDAIRSFLMALDRGDFGDLRIGVGEDRSDSAFIEALRKAVK